MSKINHAIREIHRMDEIAAREQWLNRIHPLVKLIITMGYIAVVVSFSKYDMAGVLGMAIYLVLGFEMADLSVKACIWRLRVVLPLVCMVGIANPFFDRSIIRVGDWVIHAGMISMVTLILKGVFSVMGSYLLIATTSVEKICYALRMVHVPASIVTQILLTYRYVVVLLKEVQRVTQAYALRAPKQKGIHFKVWGSLTGQMLLRSIDRANAVYESMLLRGYSGEFRYLGTKCVLKIRDICYLVVWLGVFWLLLNGSLNVMIGRVFREVIGGVFA